MSFLVPVSFLVLEQGLQIVSQQVWVGIDEERHGWIHDINSIDITIRRDFLLEHEWLRWISVRIRCSVGGPFSEDIGAHDLTSGQSKDRVVRGKYQVQRSPW